MNMLTCIACSKQSKQLNGGSLPEQEEDDTAATRAAKPTVKVLTSQIRDMAIKASGAYKNCKPCSRSSNRIDEQEDVNSEANYVADRFNFAYRRTASFDSSPRQCGKETEIRLKPLSSGDRTPASVSGRTDSVVFLEEEDEPKEWVAQVEPGVLITFVYLPQGGNDLKRIRFSREMFNKWQAQRWWAENYDKVMELYNVQRFEQRSVPLPTPPKSEDENSKPESTADSPPTPPLGKVRLPCRIQSPPDIGQYSSSDSPEHITGHSRHLCESGFLNSTPKLSSISATASVRSSWSKEDEYHSGELSISNASDMETEWVEQDESGVYITIRTLPGGTRELRRVRFSREKFGEMQARLWWEANRSRIQEQYL